MNELHKTNQDGWNDLRFYALFNSISVKSGQRVGDTERLCAKEFRLRLKRSPNSGQLHVDQQVSAQPTELQGPLAKIEND